MSSIYKYLTNISQYNTNINDIYGLRVLGQVLGPYGNTNVLLKYYLVEACLKDTRWKIYSCETHLLLSTSM
jgi:hypothetical protein